MEILSACRLGDLSKYEGVLGGLNAIRRKWIKNIVSELGYLLASGRPCVKVWAVLGPHC